MKAIVKTMEIQAFTDKLQQAAIVKAQLLQEKDALLQENERFKQEKET